MEHMAREAAERRRKVRLILISLGLVPQRAKELHASGVQSKVR